MFDPGLAIAIQRWWSRWVLRGRKPRADYVTDEMGWVLGYTARYRFTGVVLFLAFSGLYVAGYLDGDIFTTDTWGGIGVSIGSALLWLLFTGFFIASNLERVVVTPGLLRRRSWRGRQEVPWSAVNLVRIDHQDVQVRIGTEGGTVIEVSLYLDGLSALTDALQQHVRLSIDLSGAVLREA